MLREARKRSQQYPPSCGWSRYTHQPLNSNVIRMSQMEEQEKNVEYYIGQFWNWMGCLPASISLAIIIWALSGFPGLAG